MTTINIQQKIDNHNNATSMFVYGQKQKISDCVNEIEVVAVFKTASSLILLDYALTNVVYTISKRHWFLKKVKIVLIQTQKNTLFALVVLSFLYNFREEEHSF